MGRFIVKQEQTFTAKHQIQLADGSWEPLHSHDWLLSVFVACQKLDEQMLVVDFLDLESSMQELLSPFQGKSFNELSPFSDGLNPSAECIASYFYEELAPKIDDERVTLIRVELREAPHSWGIYEAY